MGFRLLIGVLQRLKLPGITIFAAARPVTPSLLGGSEDLATN